MGGERDKVLLTRQRKEREERGQSSTNQAKEGTGGEGTKFY